MFLYNPKKYSGWDHRELRLRKADGMVLFDMDDGYLMGPLGDVMVMVDQIQVRLKEEVGEILNPIKCEMWGVNREKILNPLCECPDCLIKLTQINHYSHDVSFGVSLQKNLSFLGK